MVRPSGRREGGVITQLLLFLVVSVVSGLLLAGLALPVIGGLGVGARSAAETFQPSSLETPPLPQLSRIVAADGSLIATFYEQDRIDVPLERVAPIMRKAIVAIEDSRFYEHGGLDLRGTLRAAMANRNSDETQGGSSLTQQYVKNVLLQAAVARGDDEAARQATVSTGSEGLARKLRELQYAVALEDTLSKDQILERYLNIAYFGENAYGIEAASRRYFSKSASKLTLPEAALLAGIVRSPSAYSPLQTSKNAQKRVQIAERVKGRRNVVINRMVELGYVPARQGAQAKASKIVTKPRKISSGCANAKQAPFFCDYIERQILANPIFGKTPAARRNLLFRGGVTIKTSLDPKMQKAAQAAVDKYFDPTDVPVGSMVMLEPGTGLVKAMAVSKGFGNDKLRQTTLNLAADKSNYSESGGSQSGSTFKPFVAAAALEQGYGFNYSIYSPAKLTRPVKVRGCEGGIIKLNEPYSPANETVDENGTYTMRQGMSQSINTYWLQMEELTGVCRPWRIVDAMGLRMGDSPGKPIGADPSFTLGTYPISPLQMAQAYATFASRGIACQPQSIISLTLRNGKTLPGEGARCKVVIEPEIADAVNYLLQDVVRSGSGRRSNIGRPQAGKTGTTDERRAAWYVGYTPQLVGAVGIWDPRGTVKGVKLRNIRIGGTTYPRVQGANLPAPLWGAAMKPALAGIPVKAFTPPQGRFFDGTKGAGRARDPRDRDRDEERAGEGRRGESRERSERPRRIVFPQPVPQPQPPKPAKPCKGKKCPPPPPNAFAELLLDAAVLPSGRRDS